MQPSRVDPVLLVVDELLEADGVVEEHALLRAQDLRVDGVVEVGDLLQDHAVAVEVEHAERAAEETLSECVGRSRVSWATPRYWWNDRVKSLTV